MQKQEHTPGPWEATKLDTDLRKPDTYVLGRSLPYHWTGIGELRLSGCEPGSPENEANARLIASAPELLAVCEALYNRAWIGPTYGPDYPKSGPWQLEQPISDDLYQQLIAAVRKARGELS